MIAALLALAPPGLAAYLAVRWAVPLPPTPWRTLFRLSLTIGLALGLSSLTFFLWAVWLGPQHPGLLAAELVLFAALAAVFWRAKGSRPLIEISLPSESTNQDARTPRSGMPRFAFCFVLLGAVGVAGWYLKHSPHGDWDAWAIWNLRARFLYRGAQHWTAAFSPDLSWSHPDYPLLLPAAVGRGWSYADRETTAVPRLIAGLFAAATVGLLMSVLALLRSPNQGYLGGMVLLATPYFLELATAQYADVPLAFFFLACAALFEIHDRNRGTAVLVLAGALSALAAWTKNEGLLFFAVTICVRLSFANAHRRWSLSSSFAFALGALPVLGVLLYFKLRLAPQNDLIGGQGWQATGERLLRPGRWLLVAHAFLRAVGRIGPGAIVVLAGYRWLLGPAPRQPNRSRILPTHAILAVMLAGYALVYLTTPHNLAVHLATSIDRLLMQLWPMGLLAFFLETAAPEVASPIAPPQTRTP